MLPTMTIAANTPISSATPISTDRCCGPLNSFELSLILVPAFGIQYSTGSKFRNTPQVARKLWQSALAPPEPSASETRPCAVASESLAARSLACEEAGLLHQRLVAFLLVLHPLGVISAGHEGLIERAFVHQCFPLG